MLFTNEYVLTIFSARPINSDYLNLLSIASKFHVVASFIIVNKECTRIGLYMCYFFTKFHTPSYNAAIGIAIKSKAQGRFLMASVLFHYIALHQNLHISSKIY
jgi:hypothetical protein